MDDGLYTDDDDDGGVDAQDVTNTVAIDLTEDTDEPVETRSRAFINLTSPARSSSDLDDGDVQAKSSPVVQSSNTVLPPSSLDFIPVHSAQAPPCKTNPDPPSPYEDSIDLDSYSEEEEESIEGSEDESSNEESTDSDGGPPSEINSEMERMLDNRSEFDDSEDDEEEMRNIRKP